MPYNLIFESSKLGYHGPSYDVPQTAQTNTVHDTVKRNKKAAQFGLKPGKILNITSVEGMPNFLYCARNWNLGIGDRSCGLWKGTQILAKSGSLLGLRLGALTVRVKF